MSLFSISISMHVKCKLETRTRQRAAKLYGSPLFSRCTGKATSETHICSPRCLASMEEAGGRQCQQIESDLHDSCIVRHMQFGTS